MLQYIGDPEPELRDDLIYSTFYHWITGLAECGSWPHARSNRFAQVNSKNMVRCLNFRRKLECRNGLAPVLVAVEAQLNWFAATVR
jgi:hypothetical protein